MTKIGLNKNNYVESYTQNCQNQLFIRKQNSLYTLYSDCMYCCVS